MREREQRLARVIDARVAASDQKSFEDYVKTMTRKRKPKK